MQSFTTPADMEWIELGGGSRRKIRSYNEQIMLVEVDFDEGGIGKDHTHPHAQISYILSGESWNGINPIAETAVSITN